MRRHRSTLTHRCPKPSAGRTRARPHSMSIGRCIRSGLRSAAIALATKVLLGPVGFIVRKLFAFLHSRFPTRPELVVFGSRAAREFSDNSMHLFRWCVAEAGSVIEPVWMTRSRRLRNELREAGLPVLLFPGLRALRALVSCGTVVVSYRIADVCMFSAMLRPDLRVVHLGHGIPVKRFRASLPGFSRDKLFVDELRALNEREASFVSSSDFSAAFVAEANMAPRARCPALGLPRNDALLVRQLIGRGAASDSGRKRILVAPTWRMGKTQNPSLPVWTDDDRLLDVLERADTELWIRLHPKATTVDRERIAALRERGSRFFELSSTDFPDVNSELSRFDALISDYSSIIADFMLLDRPIGLVFEAEDDALLTSRFYYPDLIDQSFPKLRGLEDVVGFIGQVGSERFSVEYGALKDLLHPSSGSACARVAAHFGFTAGSHQELA